MSADQIHVAAYSPVQECWHIETLAEHIASNARCFGGGTLKDTAYCAVALTESRERAHDLIGKIESILHNHDEGEATSLP